MTHTRTQVVMSLVAGFILGVAIFHLLPHSVEQISSPDGVEMVAVWLALGMVAMVILLRALPFHQHDFSDEGQQEFDSEFPSNGGGLIGIALGLSLHTIIEGVAIGAAVRAGEITQSVIPGLGVFLIVALHKPLDTFSITGLMQHQNFTTKARYLANFTYAATCPIFAILSYYLSGVFVSGDSSQILGYSMAFVTGVFLTISLSDLLPEIHFHRHDRGKLICALLVGVCLAYALHLPELNASQ